MASVWDDGTPAVMLSRREMWIVYRRKRKVGKLRGMVGSGKVRITRAGVDVSPKRLSHKAHQHPSDEAKEGHRGRNISKMLVSIAIPPVGGVQFERISQNRSTDSHISIKIGNRERIHDMNSVSTYNADRKSTRLNSSHSGESRMPSSA